jgi:hypothetical protein
VTLAPQLVLAAVLAIALAAITYLGLERLGRRGIAPMLTRAVAWAALALLLLNVSCPVAPAARQPLVLLDGSLSLSAAGGKWREASAAAAALGEVRRFGDERASLDSLPARGRSELGPALRAAAASDRPVVIVTDGEIDDVPDIPRDLLARASVRVFPRDSLPDLAVTAATGPARVTAGDSIALEVEVRALRGAPRTGGAIAVTSGRTRLGSRPLRFDAGGVARLRFAVPSAGLAAGDHLLRVAVAAGDGEPRTDARLLLVSIAATPGVVLVAAPGDWDARALYRTLTAVAELPVRGYLRLDAARWRSMADLAPVSADVVRRAARGADLLILKGAAGYLAAGTRARGVLVWPSGEGGEALIGGDWYLTPNESSPVAGAFLGLPTDSFPPATRLTPIEPPAGAWTALEAQESRRGAHRPAVIGLDEGRVRRVTVAVDGLWRWAFRGGSSEQAYRAWVAATASWLLGGADSARGTARPARPVVQSGRPVTFEWTASGAPRDVIVGWTAAAPGAAPTRTDTLRFDGAGRALAWLEPGEYRYRLSEGGSGTVAVESYSDELVPRPATLTARESQAPRPISRSAARDWLWLFGIAVVALAAEWLLRRRMGLK